MKMLDFELGFEGQVGKENGQLSREKVLEKKREADRGIQSPVNMPSRHGRRESGDVGTATVGQHSL